MGTRRVCGTSWPPLVARVAPARCGLGFRWVGEFGLGPVPGRLLECRVSWCCWAVRTVARDPAGLGPARARSGPAGGLLLHGGTGCGCGCARCTHSSIWTASRPGFVSTNTPRWDGVGEDTVASPAAQEFQVFSNRWRSAAHFAGGPRADRLAGGSHRVVMLSQIRMPTRPRTIRAPGTRRRPRPGSRVRLGRRRSAGDHREMRRPPMLAQISRSRPCGPVRPQRHQRRVGLAVPDLRRLSCFGR